MVITFPLILIICALICFLLAAFGVPSRVSWEPLGLALLTVAWLLVRG